MSEEQWTAVDRYVTSALVPPDPVLEAALEAIAAAGLPQISVSPVEGWALELSRPGSLVVVDNVVRGGAVADADSTDPSVQGVRRLYELIAADPRVSATAIQTVGSKGYDGFAIALVTGGASLRGRHLRHTGYVR